MSVETEVVVQLVAAQLGVSSVRESDRIVEDLGAESMDIVNIIAVVEEHYDICLEEAELPNISTVGDLAALAMRLAA